MFYLWMSFVCSLERYLLGCWSPMGAIFLGDPVIAMSPLRIMGVFSKVSYITWALLRLISLCCGPFILWVLPWFSSLLLLLRLMVDFLTLGYSSL